ncbi:AMP-binding protein [Altererythrobacter sp. MF3-039]|uniref:AMP-binding protein n=1 Tax=Altererythrobacter sp. MF3-039 TaxID=3252901 RepID=UPI00390C7D2F
MRFDQLILRDHIERAFARYSTRPAVQAVDGALTYGELERRALQLAEILVDGGVGPGEKVVLLLRNSTDYVVADMAIVLAGACKVPLNDMLAANDVAYMIDHSGASAIIAHSSFVGTIDQIADTAAKVSVRVELLDDGEPALTDFNVHAHSDEGAVPDSSDWPRAAAEDPGLIIYTGGTTGRPKGVFHTQQALAVNFFSHLINAEIAEDERLLICSPLPHSAQQFVMAALLRGAHVTIERSFEAERVLQLIEERALTWMFMVPTMIYRVLDAQLAKSRDCSSLRTIVYGASPITAARLRQGLSTFGPVFLQIYGQTEIPNLVTTLSKSDHGTEELLTSCGQPVIFCDVAIRDEAGDEVAPGEVGEITVRGFYTLERYHENPEKTDAAYTGHYLRTGDVGYQNETGHIFLVDRAKDMIISGGMNVYSTEVENVIQEVTGVGQVVVIGIPDDDWGEAVTAFVIPANDDFDPAAVTEKCRERLARYKVPKRVETVREIPLTPYGKPDKKALRASFWGDNIRQVN